jgi:hypothetical protein
MKPVYESISALTDAFCEQHLTEEYAEVCRRMTAALARKRPSPLLAGNPNTWAAGVAYAICADNWCFDKSHDPYLGAADVSAAFGLAKSTAGNKAAAIRLALKLRPYDWHNIIHSALITHPMAWYIMVDGLMLDARTLPLAIQRVAFDKGLIPGLVIRGSVEEEDEAEQEPN